MDKVILWDESIPEKLFKLSEEELDLFLLLIDYLDENGIHTQLVYDLYDNPDLWEWFGSKEPIELQDIKKEIIKKMGKAIKINRNVYAEKTNQVGKIGDYVVLVLDFHNNDVYYVSTKDELYRGLRKYLSMEKKNDFCVDMKACFPNIFFHEDVAISMNSLNRSFEEIREEIVEHLTKINDYHEKFAYLLSKNKSNQLICQEFFADTKIECSPQTGRDGIRLLKIDCYNSATKQMETIKCELHTKFKRFNIDRTKQDRIYFFPGKPGIQDGKIIVKHIGKHL